MKTALGMALVVLVVAIFTALGLPRTITCWSSACSLL